MFDFFCFCFDLYVVLLFFFFFQAEDGIRDLTVTGVQTCALPILVVSEDVDAVRDAARRQIGFYPRVPFYSSMFVDAGFPEAAEGQMSDRMIDEIGRASCRERV